MTWIERLRGWLDPEALPPDAKRPLLPRRILHGLWLVGARFHRDHCLQRAAGLSFTTLLSLIPLAVLFFSFAGLLGGGERIIAYVKEKVFPLVAPDFQSQLSEWLDTYISPTAFREGPTGLVNVGAVLGLFLAAFGMMSTAERYLNLIWGTASRRSYLQKLKTFWVVLTVSPFFLALSMWVGEFLIPKGGLIDRLQNEFWLLRALYQVLVPVVVGFMGFSLLYLLLPAARVRLASAAVGGLAAGLLWEFSRHAFFLYVERQSHITSFYPKLAMIPLFLVWVYLNWLITLIGAEVSYVHQHGCYDLLRRRRDDDGGLRWSKASVGIAFLRHLLSAFRAGSAVPNVESLARTLEVPEAALRAIARLLAERGVVIEDAKERDRFVLARDPAAILLRDVAHDLLVFEFPGDFETTTASASLRAAWSAFLASLGPRTLADAEA